MNRVPLALRSRAIALSMAAVAVVPAGLVLDDRPDRWGHGSGEVGEPSARSQPAARTLVGHEVRSVETTTYPPAHSRAWADIGMHAVSVITGTLRVHSGGPAPASYGPGQRNVAGWAPYLGRC